MRNSYRAWPPRPLSQNDVGFAFADLHAKLVYDVSPTQQISVTALGGRSTLEDGGRAARRAAWQRNRSRGLADRWMAVDARIAYGSPSASVSHRPGTRDHACRPVGSLVVPATARSPIGREVQHALGGGLLDAGAEYSRIFGARETEAGGPGGLPDTRQATWTTRAAFLNFGRLVGRGVSFESGVRMSDSTLMHQRAAAPWIRGAWRFRPTWSVNASAGGSRQFSPVDADTESDRASELVPERATHLDVGIEQRRSRVVWQATIFNRLEKDVLRRVDLRPTLGQDVILDPMTQGVYRNSLQGFSRGIELIARADGAGRLSGWVSYTGAIARQTDVATSEAFWSDADRRHAFNAAGVFRIGHQASMGVVLRAASGIPIPGYFERQPWEARRRRPSQ